MLSLPAFPFKRSSPSPPFSVLLPELPIIQSFPAPASITEFDPSLSVILLSVPSIRGNSTEYTLGSICEILSVPNGKIFGKIPLSMREKEKLTELLMFSIE